MLFLPPETLGWRIHPLPPSSCPHILSLFCSYLREGEQQPQRAHCVEGGVDLVLQLLDARGALQGSRDGGDGRGGGVVAVAVGRVAAGGGGGRRVWVFALGHLLALVSPERVLGQLLLGLRGGSVVEAAAPEGLLRLQQQLRLPRRCLFPALRRVVNDR